VFQHVLIVCIGNICRSPTAEYLLRARLAGRTLNVASAGLQAMDGHPMEATALELLMQRGIDASAHRARRVSADMLREADLVLAMEQRQLIAMMRLAPEASGKLMLLSRWCGGGDIVDPFRQPPSVFERVYGLIDQAGESWLPYL